MASRTELEPRPPETVDATPLRRGMLLAGRYEIQKVIGRGGMGLVLRARDLTLGEAVAIKIVRAEYAGERLWTERLAREVKLARQIHHPNICRVFDFEQADGRVFLVMELAAGGTLRNELQAEVVKRRPLAERLADAQAVALGLAAIHEAGIVHRDLSPQNLLRMSDGRLVVSDFGLATDAVDDTTSVQGGTVAYMAPEVIRGGHASFASDVWALGVVLHEAVFGMRPAWRDPGSYELLDPDLGRKLEAAERAVLATCRACLAASPAARPPSATDVARGLTEARRGTGWRATGWRGWSRRTLSAAASALTIASAAVIGAQLRGPGSAASTLAGVTLAPVGTPADWTDAATLLARLDGRFHCATVLPDRHTVRFVWGEPRRAEDLDTRTGERVPAPLAPETYAEGCPELSPDGRRMLYPGHTAEGRAAAFVSAHTDGRDAVPVVSMNEPSHASEPTWLPDGESFTFDIDTRHMGIYSLTSARAAVLPEPTSDPHVSASRYVTDRHLYISSWLDSASTEISGYAHPALNEEVRFHLTEMLADWRADRDTAYYATLTFVAPATVFAVDLKTRLARRLGFVRNQFVERLGIVDGGLFVEGYDLKTRLTFKDPAGDRVEVPRVGTLFDAVRCGSDLLVTEQTAAGSRVERVDWRGHVLEEMTRGPHDRYVSCAPDGKVWFYSTFGREPGLWRCAAGDCRRVVAAPIWFSEVSPDGRRVAYATVGARGPGVRWLPIDGGPGHDIADSETICGPHWSSSRTLWLARRRSGVLTWREVDADSGRETGRSSAGTTDCSDGWADPATPDVDVRVVPEIHTELRVVPAAYLR